MKIKPHHFMDIIKLYGAGFEEFVPDEKMGHDFYRVGNSILNDKNIKLVLTIQGDEICFPCKYYKNGYCIDSLDIGGFDEKDKYNKTLDERIISYYSLEFNREYTAYELCKIYLNNHDFIYEVWKEENDEVTLKRHDLFVKGACQYLEK